MMTLGQERTNDDTWNIFGKCLGNVWEMFGTFLPCKSISYVFFWEMFGKCLGNVWEMFGKCLGILKGFHSRMIERICSGMYSGMYSGMFGRICSGICSGMYSGICSGICSGMFERILNKSAERTKKTKSLIIN